MIKCELHDREKIIEQYLNAEMKEEELTGFEEHFLNCDDCMTQLRESAGLIEFVRKEGDRLFPEFYGKGRLAEKESNTSELSERENPFRTIFSPGRISFALTSIILITALYFFFMSDSELSTNEQIVTQESNPVQSPDSFSKQADIEKKLPKKNNQELYAANFIESPKLEFMVDQNFRTEHALKIISPQNEINVSDKIIFEIEYDKRKIYFLALMDNAEKVILRYPIENSRFIIDSGKYELSPGLYYWKIETNEELIYVGKFFIGKE